jgi:hypothetical protein
MEQQRGANAEVWAALASSAGAAMHRGVTIREGLDALALWEELWHVQAVAACALHAASAAQGHISAEWMQQVRTHA